VEKEKKDDLGEELADVAIYLLGMAEILGIDLEKEIMQKMEKNTKRVYEHHDGISVRVSGE
jgi:NTP pyrophosphatase (non-canonical NTP hydrolase)